MKAAALMNQPLITAFETFHKGALPQKKSFMSVDKENIQMTALKKAYRGEGTVLRMFESFGEKTEVKISLFGTEFTAEFGPYEVKTFKILEDGTVQEVDLLEWEI